MSRILFLATSVRPQSGGIAAVNRCIARALADLGCEQRLVLYHDSEWTLSADYISDGSALRAWSCGGSRRRLVSEFVRVAALWRPDIVLVDHLHLAVVPFLVSRIMPRPYVLFCHGVEFDGPLSRLRRASYRSAALRLSNSTFTARRLMNQFPGTAVEPCQLGLDELSLHATSGDVPGSFADADGNLRQVGERAVLIVGRLSAAERYKGHDQLIDVLPEVRRTIPEAQLIVVGAGNDLSRLSDLARAKGCGSAVLFTGFLEGEALAGLYARCRLFAMPSQGEGFGLVYLEAMRFAKPCIASNVDGGGEVVQDGVTGLLVDPDNLQQVGQAMIRLLADDGLSERFGRAGLQRLNSQYQYVHFRDRLRERLAALLPDLAGPASRMEPAEQSPACFVASR